MGSKRFQEPVNLSWTKKVSRRGFLKLSGLSIASTIYLPLVHNNPIGTVGPTLKSLAEAISTARGQAFGIGIELEGGDKEDPTGLPEELATNQFNHRAVKGINITCEWKRGSWDFSGVDDNVRRAEKAHQTMSGMELFWSWEETVPDWLRYGGYNREEIIEMMQEHVSVVMTRYRGIIGAYEVVNEAFKSGPGGEDWWANHVGNDYVEIAFRAARQADPDSVLFYNHYNNHMIGLSNYDITKNDVDHLKSESLIDAVGVQLHLFTGRPEKEDVIAAFQSYGIPVWVTEFDSYQFPYHIVYYPDPAKEQAEITEKMVEAALESGVCENFIFWGINDQNSCWGEEYKTNLWSNNNAKPNYYAVQRALSQPS